MRLPRHSPVGSDPEQGHSFRCPNATWSKALRRANKENVSMSYVIKMLIQGYSENVLNLPKVVIRYGDQGQPANER